jgi:hypothetical protein
LAAVVVALAVATALAFQLALYRCRTGFLSFDDEGFFLIDVKEYFAHGAMYTHVYSQYGPFYDEFFAGVFSVGGLSATHDVSRWLTAVCWVASAMLCAGATWRVTGEGWVSLVAFGVAIRMLGWQSLAGAPFSPGLLIVVLLGGMLMAATFAESSPRSVATALGAGVALLALTKVNVGVFAATSLVMALLAQSQARTRTVSAAWLATSVMFVLLPFALMARSLDESVFRIYALHVSLSALAVVVVTRTVGRTAPRGMNIPGGWALAAGGVVVLAITAIAVGTGTSVPDLITGVIFAPLQQPDVLRIAPGLPGRVLAFDALSVAVAFLYAVRRPTGTTRAALAGAAAQCAVGIFILCGAADLFGDVPFYGLAFSWVALVGRERFSFGVLLATTLAVLQALHAYPVAAAHLAWSGVPIIVVGGICLGSAAATARRVLGVNAWSGRARLALTLTLMVPAVWVVDRTIVRPRVSAENLYRAWRPLPLPGAHDVHLPPQFIAQLVSVTTFLRQHCKTFVSLPGLDSFYLWSGLRPPTDYNAGDWTYLFDDGMQQKIVDRVSRIPQLCALRSDFIEAGWRRGRPIPNRPLYRFIRLNFRPVRTYGAYQVMVRREQPIGRTTVRPMNPA